MVASVSTQAEAGVRLGGAPLDYSLLKRTLDVTFAACALLLVFLPVFAVVAPLLWLQGPIFYRQTRIGSGGRRFTCYKFRTMVPDADRVLGRMLAQNSELKRQWDLYQKIDRDPRVTGTGRFLRCTSLDELPQLWNVIKGDMSLVGPRPIVEDEIGRYSRYYAHYISLRPGLTGVWQVYGRSRVVSYRRRVAMDTWYARHCCAWVDCLLVAKTFPAMLDRRKT